MRDVPEPRVKHLLLLLTGESRGWVGRRVAAASPVERRTRPSPRAAGSRSPAANARRPATDEASVVAGVGEPERQLHPLADVVLEEKRGVDPHELRVDPATRTARLERPRASGGRVDGVGGPGSSGLGGARRSSRESRTSITCAGAPAAPGRAHVRRRRGARPVGEAAGRVPRPDDQAGTRDERIREAARGRRPRKRLQRAVGLAPSPPSAPSAPRPARLRSAGSKDRAYTEIDETNV